METFDPVKRESGVNPERTRRCDKGVSFSAAVMQAVVMSLGNREDKMRCRFLSQKTCL